MKNKKALRIAESIIKKIQPLCLPNRCMVVGSTRRGKAEVKDIEILCVPIDKTEFYRWGYFNKKIQWIKPNTEKIERWYPVLNGKYWRGLIELPKGEHIKLDLFMTTAEQWGYQSMLRTGPAKFAEAVHVLVKQYGDFRCREGNLYDEKKRVSVPCFEEKDFFHNAGLQFVPVSERDVENPYNALHWK